MFMTLFCDFLLQDLIHRSNRFMKTDKTGSVKLYQGRKLMLVAPHVEEGNSSNPCSYVS